MNQTLYWVDIDVFQEKTKVEHMNKLFVSSAYHNNKDNGKIYVLNGDQKGITEPIFVY